MTLDAEKAAVDAAQDVEDSFLANGESVQIPGVITRTSDLTKIRQISNSRRTRLLMRLGAVARTRPSYE